VDKLKAGLTLHVKCYHLSGVWSPLNFQASYWPTRTLAPLTRLDRVDIQSLVSFTSPWGWSHRSRPQVWNSTTSLHTITSQWRRRQQGLRKR